MGSIVCTAASVSETFSKDLSLILDCFHLPADSFMISIKLKACVRLMRTSFVIEEV